jgi:hypothetical protein
VDVYVTTDEGASWDKAPTPTQPTLPASGEVRAAGPVRGSVAVSLPQEGKIYGFYLVVKNRAGRGKPPPQSGDVPHVRLKVDTTPPVANLLAPQPDPSGRTNTLVMTWNASDENLAPNPITLEWAPQPGGPWMFIGGHELPNTGQYLWQIDERVPVKVYLRLTVRDLAGNVSVAQTREPVVIDLVEPDVGPVTVSPR